jgi:hypothetical protein
VNSGPNIDVDFAWTILAIAVTAESEQMYPQANQSSGFHQEKTTPDDFSLGTVVWIPL